MWTKCCVNTNEGGHSPHKISSETFFGNLKEEEHLSSFSVAQIDYKENLCTGND